MIPPTERSEPRGAHGTTGTSSAGPNRSSASYRSGSGRPAMANASSRGEWVRMIPSTSGRALYTSECMAMISALPGSSVPSNTVPSRRTSARRSGPRSRTWPSTVSGDEHVQPR